MPIKERNRKFNPDWLGNAILYAELPWSSAVVTTMDAFLKEYSQHDSYWKGLFLGKKKTAVASLLWDTHWTNGRVIDTGEEFLFIRFIAYDVNIANNDNYSDVVMTARTESIGESESALPSGRHSTVFELINGSIKITHEETVEILCCDRECQPIPIPFANAVS